MGPEPEACTYARAFTPLLTFVKDASWGVVCIYTPEGGNLFARVVVKGEE
jgi:hypothetical protein